MQADTSGHAGFDAFAAARFRVTDCRVVMLPDPLGGQFSQSMTPEQAEFLGRRLLALAATAGANRGLKYPRLYPEDAADQAHTRGPA